MSHRALVPLAFAAAVLALAPAVEAGGHHQSISIHDNDGSAFTCGSSRIRFGDEETARGEETLTASARVPLSVRAPENGGIRVQGWDRNDFSITACKAAGGDDAEGAGHALGAVSVSLSGDELTAKGPRGGNWVVFFLVQAPKGSSLRLDATNGPISIRDFDGTARVHTVNGPVSLARASGDVKVEAVNGPITLKDGSGDQRLRAQNGPISVSLSSARWEGAGLDAHTENGPVTLRVPDGFDSGVSLRTSSHSSMRCRAAQCQTARRDFRDDDDEAGKSIEFGGGATVVRLSTVNGPVSVEGRSGE